MRKYFFFFARSLLYSDEFIRISYIKARWWSQATILCARQLRQDCSVTMGSVTVGSIRDRYTSKLYLRCFLSFSFPHFFLKKCGSPSCLCRAGRSVFFYRKYPSSDFWWRTVHCSQLRWRFDWSGDRSRVGDMFNTNLVRAGSLLGQWTVDAPSMVSHRWPPGVQTNTIGTIGTSTSPLLCSLYCTDLTLQVLFESF